MYVDAAIGAASAGGSLPSAAGALQASQRATSTTGAANEAKSVNTAFGSEMFAVMQTFSAQYAGFGHLDEAALSAARAVSATGQISGLSPAAQVRAANPVSLAGGVSGVATDNNATPALSARAAVASLNAAAASAPAPVITTQQVLELLNQRLSSPLSFLA